MKTTAKVFVYIGMFLQFYLIYPIVIGAIAIRKINKATSRKQLVGISVLVLILCSFVGGIIMLNIKDFDQVVHCSNGNKLYRKEERIVIEDAKATQNQLMYAKYVRFTVYFLIVFVLSNMFFTLFGIAITRLTSLIVAILVSIISVLFVSYSAMVIVYEKSDRNVSSLTNVLLLLISYMFAFEIAIMTTTLVLDLGSTNHKIWIYIVMILISGLAMIFSLSAAVLSYVTKLRDLKRVKKTIVTETSDAEMQIESAKKLMEKNLITEEEYHGIKTRILSNYFRL